MTHCLCCMTLIFLSQITFPYEHFRTASFLPVRLPWQPSPPSHWYTGEVRKVTLLLTRPLWLWHSSTFWAHLWPCYLWSSPVPSRLGYNHAWWYGMETLVMVWYGDLGDGMVWRPRWWYGMETQVMVWYGDTVRLWCGMGYENDGMAWRHRWYVWHGVWSIM